VGSLNSPGISAGHKDANCDRLRHPLEIVAAHANRRVIQGVTKVTTDPRLIDDPRELISRWCFRLVGSRVQGTQQAVAGSEPAREEHQWIRRAGQRISHGGDRP
jgi:hypothetical protein